MVETRSQARAALANTEPTRPQKRAATAVQPLPSAPPPPPTTTSNKKKRKRNCSGDKKRKKKKAEPRKKTGTKKKKKPHTKGKPLYPLAEPKEGMNSGESITVIKSKLRKVLTKNNKQKRLFLHHVNKAVIIINQMKVKVTMLDKQLCLRMLEGNQPLPKFNQQFYCKLYTAIVKKVEAWS